MRFRLTLACSLFLLAVSCAPTPTAAPSQIVTVDSTSAAEPWLSELFDCAAKSSTVLVISADNPDISLRVGEPLHLSSPAFQIDEEEILIVTHRESPVQNLTLEQAQALFAGQGDPSVQVWVYASDADMQIAFDQLVMKGRSVSSSARLATSPQQMSDMLNAEKNAVGILPRHWKMGTVRDVYSAGTVPVLALTKSEPQGVIKDLIACLQK